MTRAAQPDTRHRNSHDEGREPRGGTVSTRIALLSTSDTDLLSARASGAGWVWANPTRGIPTLDSVDLVVVRFLGSPADLDAWRDEVFAPGRPVVVLGG